MSNRWVLLVVVAALVMLADQLTKEWVIANLILYETISPIPALSPFFRITHSTNTGAAFGIFPNAGDLFLVLAVLIVVGLLFYYGRIPPYGAPTRVGVALVVGGALGNVLDRIQHGHVTDFIHYVIPGVFSNVSNIADHAIVLGVLVMIADSFRIERIERRQQNAEQATPDQSDGV